MSLFLGSREGAIHENLGAQSRLARAQSVLAKASRRSARRQRHPLFGASAL